MRIACVHNCEWRNSGTATFALRALKEMEEDGTLEKVQHFQTRGEIPGKWDAYIHVDDGRDDLRWNPPRPCAYWAVDTHLGYGFRRWKAGHFDRVFTAQKDAVPKLERDGIKATWLPLACCPDAHPSREELEAKGYQNLDKQFDFSFVGFMNDPSGPGYNNRIDYLDKLYKAYPNSWLSTNVFFEDMAVRYVKAKIGFNISIRNDLNMRVFEVMSFGVPLFTNSGVEGITDLFQPGWDYWPYSGMGDLVNQAQFLMERPTLQAKIARYGMDQVRRFHTYRNRMETIIEEMKHV